MPPSLVPARAHELAKPRPNQRLWSLSRRASTSQRARRVSRIQDRTQTPMRDLKGLRIEKTGR
jgi:hypothetical protein